MPVGRHKTTERSKSGFCLANNYAGFLGLIKDNIFLILSGLFGSTRASCSNLIQTLYRATDSSGKAIFPAPYIQQTLGMWQQPIIKPLLNNFPNLTKGTKYEH